MTAQKTQPPDVVVVVDYRELKSAVCKEIFERGIRLNPQNLKVADFQCSDRVGVERKTQEDFLQSLIDGRLFGQAKNMCENFANPVLIIEGSADIFTLRNLHENAIRGALSSLVIDYKMGVLQTKDEKDTAGYLIQIAKREQLELKREIQVRGDKKPFSTREWQEFIVASLPNVGLALAKNLLAQFGTVEKIFSASEEELKKAEKIGEKKAREIRRIVTEKYA